LVRNETGNKDIWSEWLKRRRFGDAADQAYAMEQYKKLAAKIVDRAEIFESATVLDIGAGDGLVGLTALPKLGAGGKLILSDISEAALTIPKEIFNQKDKKDSRVEFLIAGAENLSSLPDGSVDRALMRSVILYIKNKQSVFNEMFRILRKGGRAVLMEPINQRAYELRTGLFHGYRLDGEPLLSVRNLLQKVADESKYQTELTQVTLLGYNEHDLVHMAIGAGFEEIELEYTLVHTSQARTSWNFFFDSAPNPHAPTLRELLTSILTREEFVKVEAALKKAVQLPAVMSKSLALLILKKW
jgi:arsenite methyltransferase